MANGAGAMHEHQLLELLLTYAIPRRDVNPLAHALISTFGSLRAVLDADAAELMRVEGIGESAAVLLSLAGAVGRSKAPKAGKKTFDTPSKAIEYCRTLFAGEKYERTYAVSLDNRQHMLHTDLVSTGTLTENVIYPRLVAEYALRHGANSVILTHNHPSGDPTPSRNDVEATSSVCAALGGIGIALNDHIVIGRDAAFSMVRNMDIPFEKEVVLSVMAAEKKQ